MPNFIQKRLAVHQDWFGDIPLKNQWSIQFAPRDSGDMVSFGNNIASVLEAYTPTTFPSFTDNMGIFEAVSDNVGGMLLAQSVAMPTESFEVSDIGLGNTGGFLQGKVGGKRSAPSKLSVGFIETNVDIFAHFIKPWMVAASFKGLIEDDGPNIKCNINIAQYTRLKGGYPTYSPEGGSEEISISKMSTFYNCVPTNVVEDQISYGEISADELIREVDFIYSHYDINTP